jgi:hypothetical protein
MQKKRFYKEQKEKYRPNSGFCDRFRALIAAKVIEVEAAEEMVAAILAAGDEQVKSDCTLFCKRYAK